MDNITEWIIKWLVSEGGADENIIVEKMDENYFAAGFIDSFKFINMISDAEEEFDIEFDNDQFEDRSFSTINGLAKIIRGLINNGEN